MEPTDNAACTCRGSTLLSAYEKKANKGFPDTTLSISYTPKIIIVIKKTTVPLEKKKTKPRTELVYNVRNKM